MNTRVVVAAVFLAGPVLSVVATALWPRQAATGVALGRLVYIAEGCINCHSQYVRPATLDTEAWGDARDPDWSRRQTPVLIGNRRQGPDLMNVGRRLPRDWHRLHLIDPRRVLPSSRMPSYAHLFAPGEARGEALLDYLASPGGEAPSTDSAIAPPARPTNTATAHAP